MYNKYDSFKHEYDSQFFIAPAYLVSCVVHVEEDEKKNDNNDEKRDEVTCIGAPIEFMR